MSDGGEMTAKVHQNVYRILRIDRSPMNPKVWVAQLECGKNHDVYLYRKPRITQMLPCERCNPRDSNV